MARRDFSSSDWVNNTHRHFFSLVTLFLKNNPTYTNNRESYDTRRYHAIASVSQYVNVILPLRDPEFYVNYCIEGLSNLNLGFVAHQGCVHLSGAR